MRGRLKSWGWRVQARLSGEGLPQPRETADRRTSLRATDRSGGVAPRRGEAAITARLRHITNFGGVHKQSHHRAPSNRTEDRVVEAMHPGGRNDATLTAAAASGTGFRLYPPQEGGPRRRRERSGRTGLHPPHPRASDPQSDRRVGCSKSTFLGGLSRDDDHAPLTTERKGPIAACGRRR